MVTASVASSSLSSNDISILAHILEVPFQYKKKHESPFTEDYLKKLCVIAGLGFTTILADGTFISMYQPHLSSLMLSLERKDGGGNFFPDLAFWVKLQKRGKSELGSVIQPIQQGYKANKA